MPVRNSLNILKFQFPITLGYSDRSNGKWVPQIGFSRDIPHANLSNAGHRMLGHQLNQNNSGRPMPRGSNDLPWHNSSSRNQQNNSGYSKQYNSASNNSNRYDGGSNYQNNRHREDSYNRTSQSSYNNQSNHDRQRQYSQSNSQHSQQGKPRHQWETIPSVYTAAPQPMPHPFMMNNPQSHQHQYGQPPMPYWQHQSIPPPPMPPMPPPPMPFSMMAQQPSMMYQQSAPMGNMPLSHPQNPQNQRPFQPRQKNILNIRPPR
jgi:hypothetical protein